MSEGAEVLQLHEPSSQWPRRAHFVPTDCFLAASGKIRAWAQHGLFWQRLTEVMRPVLGMTHDERMTLHRRSKLTPAAKRECDQLDARMASLVERERTAKPETLPGIQKTLFADRTRFKALAC